MAGAFYLLPDSHPRPKLVRENGVKAVFVVVFTLSAMLPTSAFAERGWACAEGGQVQKYKRVGNTLVMVGNSFSNLIQSANRALGEPEDDLLQKWQILVDNADGVVAVMSTAEKSTENGMRTTEHNGIGYAYANVLLINKTTGRFRHLESNLSARNDSSTSRDGTCVEY